MNILMITGDRALASGKKSAFYNTLEELRKHFDRIDIICPKIGGTSEKNLHPFENVFIHPSLLPLIFQWLWIYREGNKIISEHHSSIMTVHEYAPFYNGIGARLLHYKTRIPYILEIMHVPGVPCTSGIQERFYRWLTHTMIAWDAQSAKAVRVINQRQTPDFLIGAGVPREKLIHIPAFYIDLDIFKQLETSKQYDVIFIGRMANNKGLDLFLDIVERSKFTAVCVGDGPLLSWACAEASRRKLKIYFAGFAKDSAQVACYINESRLLIMSSLNEGGPRVVLEAMACGVPVVATPVGIVSDVLPPECITDWDADDISDKVKRILDDQTLYAQLRESGIRTASQFERTSAITKYSEFIKQTANA